MVLKTEWRETIISQWIELQNMSLTESHFDIISRPIRYITKQETSLWNSLLCLQDIAEAVVFLCAHDKVLLYYVLEELQFYCYSFN